MKKIIGCDPGVEGAIVVLNEQGEIEAAFNMPINETQVPKKIRKPKPGAPPKKVAKKSRPESLFSIRRKVDYHGVVELLGRYSQTIHIPEIYVEEFTHLFNLPSSSNFDLGYGIGVLHSAISTIFDEFYVVPPKKWQSRVWSRADVVYKESMRVDTKATSKKAFERIFPTYKGVLNSDGIRDAALIAYCGLRGGL